MSAVEKAKSRLEHYFRVAFGERQFDVDNVTEIHEFVDLVVEGAVEKAMEKFFGHDPKIEIVNELLRYGKSPFEDVAKMLAEAERQQEINEFCRETGIDRDWVAFLEEGDARLAEDDHSDEPSDSAREAAAQDDDVDVISKIFSALYGEPTVEYEWSFDAAKSMKQEQLDKVATIFGEFPFQVVSGTRAQWEIFAAIVAEREYQDEKWGTVEVTPHSILEWVVIMEEYLKEAKKRWMNDISSIPMRQEILKAAAVGVAMLEQHGLPEIDR